MLGTFNLWNPPLCCENYPIACRRTLKAQRNEIYASILNEEKSLSALCNVEILLMKETEKNIYMNNISSNIVRNETSKK